MIAETIARSDARHVYNRLGERLEQSRRFEELAKTQALEWLAVEPGQRVLQVGVGTGIEHAALAAVAGDGPVVGVDLARTMLELTYRRTASPLCEADAIALPLASGTFDRIYSAYMLDLLPADDLLPVLAEFRRVLHPQGRMVLVSLTEGVDPASHLFIAAWKLGFRLDPRRLGGCRPLNLQRLLGIAGFASERRVIVQRGFPSEVLLAWKDETADIDTAALAV
jgi:ubiquinone/menaquinone biosynthesis C-methylase UbiE